MEKSNYITNEIKKFLPIPETQSDKIFTIILLFLIVNHIILSRSVESFGVGVIATIYISVKYLIFKNPHIKITINPKILLSVFVILFFVFYNILCAIFFSTDNTSYYLLEINKNIITTAVSAIMFTIVYVLAVHTLGNFLLKISKTNTYKSTMYRFINIIGLGLLGFSYIMFALLKFEHFKPQFVYPIILILALFSLNKIPNIINKIREVLNRKYRLENLSVLNFIFYSALFLYIVIVSLHLLKSFVHGADAYRIYLALPKDLVLAGRFPLSNAYIPYPYLASIMFAPALMFGGIENIIFTTYSISLLFIIGFYLLTKNLTANDNPPILLIILAAAFYPAVSNILIAQYKDDLILLFYASLVFLNFMEYIKGKKNEKGPLYLTIIFITTSLLIKLTAIYYAGPILLIILAKELRIKNIKILLLCLILSIGLIAPWIILNLTSINRTISDTISGTQESTICARNYHKEEESYIYKFEHNAFNYLTMPLLYFSNNNNSKSTEIGNLMCAGFTPFLACLIIIFFRLKNKFSKTDKIILFITSTGYLLLLISNPLYTWYFMPNIFLFMSLGLSKMDYLSSSIKQSINMTIIFFVSLYLLAFFLLYARTFYYPPQLSSEIFTSKTEKTNYKDFKDTAEILK